MKALIESIEKEFLEFMGLTDNLNYGFRIFDLKDKPNNPIYFVEQNTENHYSILNLEKHIFEINNYFPKPILFHEFTHLYHDQYLLEGIYDNIFIQYNWTRYYSEYFSVFVQMKSATGFECYHDNKRLSLKSNIKCEFYNCDIETYLSNITKDYISSINAKISEKKIDKGYIFLFTIYYFSIINFIKEYCVEKIPDVVNDKFFIDIWGEELINYVFIISHKKPCKEMFDEAFVKYINMMDYFNNKFNQSTSKRKL